MRMIFDPPKTKPVVIEDGQGRRLAPAEIASLSNKRIKWARRSGARMAVMLDGPVKGEEGTLLFFPDPADYELTIAKVFARTT